MTTKKTAKTSVFAIKMAEYKRLIDDDIVAYSKQIRKSTLLNYGAYASAEADAFLSILERGGKRLRGALVMLGYEMSGGTNTKMILEAARAIEMLHAYILIIDDIQDRSVTRRGGKAAHIMLADYHRKHELAGDAGHFGMSIALNAGFGGAHAANIILANLNTDEDARLRVVSIANRTMLVTAHGQTADIMNEVVGEVTEKQVDDVMKLKSATYTILNPLHVGMVLAGADCHATDAITPYATHVGQAFQNGEDNIGMFGTEFETGKSPMDDMREGKRTLLTVYALKHAAGADKNFLIQMLGNTHITPAEFKRCQDIITESGALEYAQKRAQQHVKSALESLNHEAHRWSPEGVGFLQELAEYLLVRNA